MKRNWWLIFPCAYQALKRAVAICALLVVFIYSPTIAQSQGGQYQAYPLRHKKAGDLEQPLVEMLRHLGPTTHVVADLRSNQILVRGPEGAHQIARQYIDALDRPTVAQTTSPSVLRAYPCPNALLASTAAQLQARYADHRNVRAAADPGTSQVIVLAPPEIHALVAQEIPRSAPLGTVNAARPAPVADVRTAEQFVALAHVPLARLEPQVRQLLGSRLEPLRTRGVGGPDYLFVDAASRRVELTFDFQTNGVQLVGSGPVVLQLARLLLTLDGFENPQRKPGTKIRIIPVHRADPTKVHEAVEAYRRGSGVVPAAPRPSSPTATPGLGQTGRFQLPGRTGIVLTQNAVPTAQAGAPAAPAGVTPIPATEEELRERQDQREHFRELGESVEIETLPDLDVIILRGRDSEVDEVSRIIAEIERLSAETVPEIDIYQLRYISGLSLVTILDLCAEDLASGRQGKVHVTPLVKPNALLLIGWGEAVKAIKELIAKLDQPVAPHTQMRVYRLRHAPAESASQVLQETFTNSEGLGPRVEITVDTRTNSLIVRAAPRDLAEVDLLISRIDQGTSGAVSQARLFKLNNALANDLAGTLQAAIDATSGGAGDQKSSVLEFFTADMGGQRILKSGILSDVQITPDPHTNTLVITAPADSMDLLAALIGELDSPTAVAQIKVFKIENGDAASLVDMLQTLLPSQAGVAGPQLAGAEGETTLVPVQFSFEPRTNSIIATGSQGDLVIIEALLLRLESEEIEERRNEVYRLKNAPAEAAATTVNEFLRSERQLQQAAPGVLNPFEQIESEVVIVAEPVSNALIISATPRYFQDIMDLVEQLDEQPPQVMIQVVIAEVDLNSAEEFGVELGLQDSVLFDRSLLSNLEKITRSEALSTNQGVVTTTEDIIIAAEQTPGFDFNNNPLGNAGSEKSLANAAVVGAQGLSSFLLGRTNAELGYGGLVLSASSDSVSLLLRALQETRRLEVLSRPQIMTLDNQSAFIQVGKRVPLIRAVRTTINSEINEVVLENTGLILGVTPRISPDGMVVMEIDAEKSELGPEQEGTVVSVVDGDPIRQPPIETTLVQTTVSASDGETIVMGGLITKSVGKIKRRVPVLSDIPVLGCLFRFDAEIDKRSELLIFLTPHVVRSSEDADRIKQLEAARMSWCLTDVHEIHGPTGLYEDRDTSTWKGQGEVVYPDVNPEGLVPGEFSPRQVPLEELDLSPPIEELPVTEPTPMDNGASEPARPLRSAPPNEPRIGIPRNEGSPSSVIDSSPSGLPLPPPIQDSQGALQIPSRSAFGQGVRPTASFQSNGQATAAPAPAGPNLQPYPVVPPQMPRVSQR